MDSNRRFDAARIAAALADMTKEAFTQARARVLNIPLRKWLFSSLRSATLNRYRNLYRPNGARECARRRSQIACGQLKRENGLSV